VGKQWRRGEHWQVDDTRPNRGEMVAHHGGLKDALGCSPWRAQTQLVRKLARADAAGAQVSAQLRAFVRKVVLTLHVKLPTVPPFGVNLRGARV
jgi:hypothetical protein